MRLTVSSTPIIDLRDLTNPRTGLAIRFALQRIENLESRHEHVQNRHSRFLCRSDRGDALCPGYNSGPRLDPGGDHADRSISRRGLIEPARPCGALQERIDRWGK